MRHSSPSCHAAAVDDRLESVLRYAIAIGAVLVLLLPAARGSHDALGWLPLWLLAMPVSAWWALHRFAMPDWSSGRAASGTTSRRRVVLQARRRVRPARPLALPRAADTAPSRRWGVTSGTASRTGACASVPLP